MDNKKKAASQSRRIRILNPAYQDINNITNYIANINLQPLNAINVTDAIFNSVDKISLNPFAYKECEQILTKTKIYRQAVCLSWLIIYKVLPSEITILGIIHGSRKPSKIKRLRKQK